MTITLTAARRTARSTFFLLAVMAATWWAGTSTIGAEQQTRARQLLQEAMHEEEALGNVTTAVDLYERVLSAATTEEDGVAATAQLRLGLLYERLGRTTDAQRAFEAVVSEYAEQIAAVQLAQARLTAFGQDLAAQNTKRDDLTLRRLSYEQLDTPFARLSPDGQTMAYSEYRDNEPFRIRLLDLASGADRVLVEGRVGGQFRYTWSPDGIRLAYVDGGRELRVIPVTGGSSDSIFHSPDAQIYVSDWSPDGSVILCQFDMPDWTSRLTLVSPGGDVQQLLSVRARQLRSMGSFSRDGRLVAAAIERDGNTDVYVWATDGSSETRVTTAAGRDENPLWSADGKHLVFLSDRGEGVDLWAVETNGAVPVGRPFIVKKDMGWRVRLLDLTPDGKLNVFMRSGVEPDNLFVLDVAPEQGGAKNVFAPLTHTPPGAWQPRWSPGGDRVAYTSRKGEVGWPRVFILSEDGAEREISAQGHYVNALRWHPDGLRLLFAGWDQNGRTGVFRITLATNEIETLYDGGQVGPSRTPIVTHLQTLPATARMMFFKYLGRTNGFAAYTSDLDGSNVEQLWESLATQAWPQPSPDGQHVNYSGTESVERTSLYVVSVPGDTPALVGHSPRPNLIMPGTWSPDSRHLLWGDGQRLKVYSVEDRQSETLFETRVDQALLDDWLWSPNGRFIVFGLRDTASETNPAEFFIMPAGERGTPTLLARAPGGFTRFGGLRWSRDGRKILATGGGSGPARAGYEYWIMENFLPSP